MANTIALAKQYLPLLDEVFKMASKTDILINNSLIRPGTQANEVLIPKMTLQGLGNYSKATGFVDGDVTLEWQTHKLERDRGRSFTVDAMDDLESVNQAFGSLANQFITKYVVPEVDAYRIAKLFTLSGNQAEATLTKTTVVGAIDTASQTLTDAEVPLENRVLLVTPALYTNLKQSDLFVRNISVEAGNSIDTRVEMYNSMPVIVVPQTRMYTAITLRDGATGGQEAGGYTKAGGGKDINFLMIHTPSVLAVTKHIAPRIFDPSTNQDADAWKFQYRVYHDLIAPDNKVNGIYVHHKA
jgi:hypothetical protein